MPDELLWGYNTNGFAHHRLEDALEILAEMGYRSVALTLDHHALNPFDPDLPAQLARVHALLIRFGLRCVIETGARFLLDPRRKHQPTLVGPEIDNGPRMEFLKKAIDIAGELGADAVSFWSGQTSEGIAADMKWNHLVRCCKALCRHAQGKGVRLAFEPEPGMFVDTMKRFATLVKRVDHPLFGLTLDVGHLVCQGEVPVGRHIRAWRELLWNVHIEDMRTGVHDHLMFGEGEVDFAEALGALREVGYTGGVYVELSRHSHDAVSTARQALAFLQSV
jgi:sugar phosphate isomerase/epimerase